MDSMETMTLSILFLLLAGSSYFDIRYRRIPNWFTFPGMLSGLVLNLAIGGVSGGLDGLAGLALGMAVLMPFYAFGVMGAGDVKLMGAVGAFLGLKGSFYAFLAAGVIGGLHAVILLAMNPRHGLTILSNFWTSLKFLFLAGRLYLPSPLEGAPKQPYGVDIALGGMGYAAWSYMGYASWSQFIAAISSNLI